MTFDCIPLERLRFESTMSFEQTLALIDEGIGHPDMARLSQQLTAAESASEFNRLVHNAVGSADLMEFLRIDLGVALRINRDVKPSRIIRIIAGNPVIMEQLTRSVPDAGSYAPVTILVYELRDRVCVCYDTMQSLLAPYGSSEAIDAARALDAKVIKLLSRCESEARP